ncbi:uncharacterized protein LOC130672302 [Microplitis mediator]|uniref:uncharacterized protein LOC130672302 n=1 Tax=Microplitis mediator TaxID=375433 RepID=UPI002554BB37|nr:uncharacterized protein LOC130672302 [Microplitis mediator]
MDEFVSDILRRWNLEDLLQIFEEEKIDEEAFKALDNDAINNIIPRWGWRVKFKKKYEAFKNNENREFDGDDIEVNGLSRRLSQLQPPNNSFLNVPTNPLPRQSINRLTLRTFLNSSLKGKMILRKYESTKTVDRNNLCELIIFGEFDDNENYKINEERFVHLANEIIELFPTELREIYYIPRTINDGGIVIRASGSLYSKYNNTRRELNVLDMMPKDLLNNNKPVQMTESESADLVDDNIEWLQNNLEPFDEIMDKWIKTIDKRHHFKNKSIEQYFNTFECLKHSEGYKLLLQDFDSIYPDKVDKFYLKWPVIAPKIINIAKKKKFAEAKMCISKYSRLNESGHQSLLALLLLPLLFTTVNIKSKKPGEHWRPEKEDTQKSFLLHIETEDELIFYQNERTKICEKYNLSVQPYVVISGPINNLVSSSVHINNTKYNFDSPEEAIDSCFKFYYSLNAEYTAECRQVWTFLANFIYEFNEKHSYSSVYNLISNLKC